MHSWICIARPVGSSLATHHHQHRQSVYCYILEQSSRAIDIELYLASSGCSVGFLDERRLTRNQNWMGLHSHSGKVAQNFRCIFRSWGRLLYKHTTHSLAPTTSEVTGPNQEGVGDVWTFSRLKIGYSMRTAASTFLCSICGCCFFI